jgi:hypothetical protein
VNQEQAVIVARKAHVPMRRHRRSRSAFTADLLGTVLLEHGGRFLDPLR